MSTLNKKKNATEMKSALVINWVNDYSQNTWRTSNWKQLKFRVEQSFYIYIYILKGKNNNLLLFLEIGYKVSILWNIPSTYLKISQIPLDKNAFILEKMYNFELWNILKLVKRLC